MRMKKIATLFVLMMFGSGLLHAVDTSTAIVTIGDSRQKTLSELIGYNLPVLWIETVDGVEPTCERVYAPAGSWGSTVNSEKAPGRLIMYSRIEGKDSVLYDSGDYEKDVSGMTIKVRGNSSAVNDKKPYKVKLQKKFDLLMRGVDSVYKDKEWALLIDGNMYTSTAFNVSRMVGMTWVPGGRYVNVVMNGIYRGVYLLTEQVKRNPDCRLNVDKNCGFIFECDVYWWNEPVYVYSCDAPGYNYTFKYPDEDDITEEQLAYMQSLVNAYEESLNTGTYPEMIDVPSFASWCLVHDIMGIKDGGGCNRYYTKYDTTAASKIVMPVAWDFDMAERTRGEWSRCHTVYMKKLFNSSNPAFVHEYVRQWCKLREIYSDNIETYFENFSTSDEGLALAESFKLDNMAWGFSESFWFWMTRRYWLRSRYEWLDANIMALHVPNDVNIDGTVNIADVTELIGMLLGGDVIIATGDINGDESVTITDVTELISILMQ